MPTDSDNRGSSENDKGAATVKNEGRLEQRLQDFYDRVPDVEDALPFKDYLLKHEDSRMAWYLLGKQYALKGEQAKANYCFHQAGEIYEAFEAKPAPDAAALPNSEGGNRRRSRKPLIAGVLVLVLAGIAIPGWKAFAPSGGQAGDEAAVKTMPISQSLQPSQEPPATGTVASPANAGAAEKSAPGMIASAVDPDTDGRFVLGELLMQPKDRKPLILVKSASIGNWRDWLGTQQPVASITAADAAGSSQVQWFDKTWCNCQPADMISVRQRISEWKPVQEEKLVLVSAVAQYRAETGKLPALPEDLAGDYPLNRMAGWSDAMNDWFRQLTDPKAARDKARYPLPDWPTDAIADDAEQMQDSRAVPAGEWQDLTEQPLEVIVDKTHHRLAVVSGNVLLRNYAVGLGGNRTPEGQFFISEKVRDPNGEPEGVFGNRGMTLSDTRYGIHGTDKPGSIGKDESLGCVRMAQEDIEELYDLVPMGTKVTIKRGGLPSETRAPPVRFRLPQTQDETNPHKVYDWLD